MPEEKILLTQTSVSIIGSAISIRSYYNGEEAANDTLAAFISDIVQTVDGVGIIEGELSIQMNENYPLEIDYTIDSNGDLIVNSDDANNYSINSSGQLIYTD